MYWSRASQFLWGLTIVFAFCANGEHEGARRAEVTLSPEDAIAILRSEPFVQIQEQHLNVTDVEALAEALVNRPTFRRAFELVASGQSDSFIVQGAALAFAKAQAVAPHEPVPVGRLEYESQTNALNELVKAAYRGQPFSWADMKQVALLDAHPSATALERATLTNGAKVLASLKVLRALHPLMSGEKWENEAPQDRVEKIALMVEALHTLVANHKDGLNGTGWKYDLCSQTGYCKQLEQRLIQLLDQHETLRESLGEKVPSDLKKRISAGKLVRQYWETIEESEVANHERGTDWNLARGALVSRQPNPSEAQVRYEGAQDMRMAILRSLEKHGVATSRLRDIDGKTSQRLTQDFSKRAADYEFDRWVDVASIPVTALTGGALSYLSMGGKAVVTLRGLAAASALGGLAGAGLDVFRQELEMGVDPGNTQKHLDPWRVATAFGTGSALGPLGARFPALGNAMNYVGAAVGFRGMAYHLRDGKTGSAIADATDVLALPAVLWGFKKIAGPGEFNKQTLQDIDTIFQGKDGQGGKATAAEIELLETVHRIGRGEIGKDGVTPARIGNYTDAQIDRKFVTAVEGLAAESLSKVPAAERPGAIKTHLDRAIGRVKQLMDEGILGDPESPGKKVKKGDGPHTPKRAQPGTGDKARPPKKDSPIGTVADPKESLEIPRVRLSGPKSNASAMRAEVKANYDKFVAAANEVAVAETKLSRAKARKVSDELLGRLQRSLDRAVASLETERQKLGPEELVRYAFEDREAFAAEVIEVKLRSYHSNQAKVQNAKNLEMAKTKLQELRDAKADPKEISAADDSVDLARDALRESEAAFEATQWHMGLLQTANKLGRALMDGAVVLGVMDYDLMKAKDAVNSEFANYALGFNVARTKPYFMSRGTNHKGKAVGGYRDWVPDGEEVDPVTFMLDGAISPETGKHVYATPNNDFEIYARIAQDQVNGTDLAQRIAAGDDVEVLVNFEGGVSPAKTNLKMSNGHNWNGEGGEAQGGGRGQLSHAPGGKELTGSAAFVMEPHSDGTVSLRKIPITGKVKTVAHSFNNRNDVVALTRNMPLGNQVKVGEVVVPAVIRRSMLDLVANLAAYRAAVNKVKNQFNGGKLRVFDTQYVSNDDLDGKFLELVTAHVDSAHNAIAALETLKTDNPTVNFDGLEFELARALGSRFSEIAGISPPKTQQLYGPGNGRLNNFLKVGRNAEAFLEGQESYLTFLRNNVDFDAPIDPRTRLPTVRLSTSGSIVIVPRSP